MRFAACLLAVVVCSSLHAQNKLEPAKQPAPPPAANVNVLNFPEVQAVGGTVDVGNLPLDADGAVRVSSAAARQPVLVELLTEDLWIDPHTVYTSSAVDTSAYSQVGVRYQGSAIGVDAEWRWKDDDSFGIVTDSRNGSNAGYCRNNTPLDRIICAVSGVELRFRIDNIYDVPVHFTSLKVYLIP